MNLKGIFKVIIFIIVIAVISEIIVFINKPKPNEFTPYDDVSYNGWLTVEGKDIKNEKGEKIQLVGVSTHGIQWFYQFITPENLRTLKNDWGANVIRLAIYVDVNGELVYDEFYDKLIIEMVNLIIENDMYVILDWHILEEENPNSRKKEAITFFNTMSEIYADKPNVMYEICNEPNGEDVTWNKEIKPYAEELIQTIRKNSPKSIIIVGTPQWSKKFDEVIENPIEQPNILYAYHFYAGSSENTIKDIEKIINSNIPILVTEWGVTDNTGDGKIYLTRSAKIIDFLNKQNIGWIAWSFSWKYESTALIDYTYDLISDINDNLSETGTFVKRIMKNTKGK